METLWLLFKEVHQGLQPITIESSEIWKVKSLAFRQRRPQELELIELEAREEIELAYMIRHLLTASHLSGEKLDPPHLCLSPPVGRGSWFEKKNELNRREKA